MRSEKKSVLQTATSLGLKDPQYDEWTTSLHYMREFMSHYQWPEDLMGPPERYTVQSLLARIHPRFKDGKVIGEWDGEGPPPEMEEGMGAFHGIEVAPASQDIV